MARRIPNTIETMPPSTSKNSLGTMRRSRYAAPSSTRPLRIAHTATRYTRVTAAMPGRNRATIPTSIPKAPSSVSSHDPPRIPATIAKAPSTSREAAKSAINTSSVMPVHAKAAMPSRMPATPRIARAHQLILTELPIDHSSYSRARGDRFVAGLPKRSALVGTRAHEPLHARSPPTSESRPGGATIRAQKHPGRKPLLSVFCRALRGHWEARFDPLAEGVRAHRPSDPVPFHPVVHQHQGRDAADAKPVLQARLQVCIHLDRLQPSGELVGQPFDRWSNHAARAAPGSPEVVENRDRAPLDDRGEIRRPAMSQPRQRLVAFRAVRNAFGGAANSGLLATFRAADDRWLSHFHRCLRPRPPVFLNSATNPSG